ncbi:LysM peptidoglycan-binding domain-containing protein [Alicyclobacillus fastidiosus]|uniref:LysM peptidoglycan-binding domain-containing protein n=1 Tax=Alicyclobacillus fastidiosus TaxID=392011 RepID=A0ABV5AMC2_9BACL|nr:LysM peptidoglycan-binding domain-containing protein [Alicyclobacillus fastidiosus]WEH08181.1 LysM peptidoglycan-binding domain-containing protein [Alicyclobacillus fastidiosus]
MSSAYLIIGNYKFALLPKESMDFDFGRSIYKLDTQGAPTYQDLGVDEKTLSFSGSIVGTGAWTQAETIESLMDKGLPQKLVYSSIQRSVRINKFSPKYVRDDRVDFSINLIVIPSTSGYNAAPTQVTVPNTTLPAKAPPKTTSTASIAQYCDKSYTVKSGDTLWAIAQRTLGSSASANGIATLVNTIAKANQLSNPNLIKVGQVLKIPSTSANQSSANAAYTSRQTATVTTAGINYLQTQESSVRFTGGAAS